MNSGTPKASSASERAEGPPALLFISSAPADVSYRDALLVHLADLSNGNLIRTWHTGLVEPGAIRDEETARAFDAAQLILLLASADFLTDPDCLADVTRVRQRPFAEGHHVYLVRIRACDISDSVFFPLMQLPSNGVPVASWDRPDEAWASIVAKIRGDLCSPQPSTDDKSANAALHAAPQYTVWQYVLMRSAVLVVALSAGMLTVLTLRFPVQALLYPAVGVIAVAVANTALTLYLTASSIADDPSASFRIKRYKFCEDMASHVVAFSLLTPLFVCTMSDPDAQADPFPAMITLGLSLALISHLTVRVLPRLLSRMGNKEPR